MAADNEGLGSVPTPDVVQSTTTETVPYTDIIVTLSTSESTAYTTITQDEEVIEMYTKYSATNIVTVTMVVPSPTPAFEPTMKRRSHKKRGCGRPSSTAPSSTPVETATPSSTSALYPIASNCPSLEEYSSACACIAGPTTLTAAPATSTEIVTVTERSAVPSTSTSIVIVVVSSTIIESGSQTITVTVPGGVYQTTTTVTSTSTPAPPTQTAHLAIEGAGPNGGKLLKVANGYLIPESTPSPNPQEFLLTTAGGQPVLASDPSVKLYLRSPTTTVALLYFETESNAVQNGDTALTCNVPDDGYLACSAPSRGMSVMLNCGAYLYLATPTASIFGCNPVKFKLSA